MMRRRRGLAPYGRFDEQGNINVDVSDLFGLYRLIFNNFFYFILVFKLINNETKTLF